MIGFQSRFSQKVCVYFLISANTADKITRIYSKAKKKKYMCASGFCSEKVGMVGRHYHFIYIDNAFFTTLLPIFQHIRLYFPQNSQ